MGTQNERPANVRAYNETVTRLQSEAGDNESTRVRELAALVEMTLGEPLPETIFRDFANVQLKFWHGQARLAAEATAEAIPYETYHARLVGLMQSTMEENRRILGQARFDAIFGEAGNSPQGMIEPDIEEAIRPASFHR